MTADDNGWLMRRRVIFKCPDIEAPDLWRPASVEGNVRFLKGNLVEIERIDGGPAMLLDRNLFLYLEKLEDKN